MPAFAHICRLLLLLLLQHSPAFSAELPVASLADDDVEVVYRDGTYFARFACSVSVSPAVALDVLIDFNHMVGVVPNLESSEVVSRRENVFVVRQRGTANFGPFAFPFESQRQIEVLPDGRILARALSGTTKHMHSEMRVQAQGNGTRLDYRVEIVPDRWVPSSIGIHFMSHEIAEQFSALFREMERRQASRKGR